MKRRRIPRSRAEGRVPSAVTAAAAGAMGMARKCCVRSCKADVREARAKGLPLHKFPKDAALRDRWLASGGFDASFKPTPGQVVCHRHFKRADYEAARGGHKLLLKRGSVPTVFAGYDDHPGTCDERAGGAPVRLVPREPSVTPWRKTQRSLRLAHPSLSLSPARARARSLPLPSSFALLPSHLLVACRCIQERQLRVRRRNVSRRAGVMPVVLRARFFSRWHAGVSDGVTVSDGVRRRCKTHARD